MERVPLSVFVNFMLTTKLPKLQVVKGYKDTRYTGVNFYRHLREAIVDMHEKGRPATFLDNVLPTLSDERKRQVYPGLIAGYQRWIEREQEGELRWYPPPHTILPIGELEVDLVPEIGLYIGGKPFIIVLSFTSFSLARADLTLALLTAGLGPTRPGTTFAMLDVGKARLHTTGAISPRLGLLARGEAASFLKIYEAV
jgi:hypothetical protein